MNTIRGEVGRLLLLAAVLFAPTVVAGQGRAPQVPTTGFADLITALKATPGCVGVETARTGSGKQVIFAWFENKKAALAWYYSDTHMSVVRQFALGAPSRTPLAGVPDDGEPVLAIASLTLTTAQTSDSSSLPISQIAIELYRPLPGGIALGGQFAPTGLKVPGMQTGPLGSPTKPNK